MECSIINQMKERRTKKNRILRFFSLIVQIVWMVGSFTSLCFFSYEIAIRRGFFPEWFDSYLMVFWGVAVFIAGVVLIYLITLLLRGCFKLSSEDIETLG